MQKVKVFKNGNEQIIVLPKNFDLPDEELFIGRDGNVITLMTKDEAWKILDDALNGFTDDFMPNGREPQTYIK